MHMHICDHKHTQFPWFVVGSQPSWEAEIFFCAVCSFQGSCGFPLYPHPQIGGKINTSELVNVENPFTKNFYDLSMLANTLITVFISQPYKANTYQANLSAQVGCALKLLTRTESRSPKRVGVIAYRSFGKIRAATDFISQCIY